MVPFETAMVISYMLYIVTIVLSLTIWPQFVIEILQCSNQQGWVTLQQNLGRKELTDVSQILMRSQRHMGLSYAKEIVLISSAV